MFHKVFVEKVSLKEYVLYLTPSIVSMIFLSFYTTIDGFFVSRYVNSNALAAINIVIPLTCIFFGISIMIASGGGALIGIRQGQGHMKKANSLFTALLILLTFFVILLTILILVFLDKILIFSGSTEALMPYTKSYGFWTAVTIPAMMYKLFLEHMARVDGHPKVSMVMSISGLIANVIINYILIVKCDMGIAGAGIGTSTSMYISAFIGVFHFTLGSHNLNIASPKVRIKDILHSCGNGLSELMTELSTGVTTLLFNITLLSISGEIGIASMSILGYYYYFFTSFYFGITMASQPIISYNYGSGNSSKIKETTGYALKLSGFFGLLITGICIVFSHYLVSLFSSNSDILNVAVPAIKLFSITFLISGFNIFASGYFTAIGKGLPSAIISFSRSLVFVIIYLETLPKFMGVKGIWLTDPFAEITTIFVVVILIICYRKKTKSF